MTSIGLLLMLVAVSAFAQEVQVEQLDGKHLAGRLVSLTTETISIETVEGNRTVNRGDVLRVEATPLTTPLPATQRRITVKLVDGSTIVATNYKAERGRATISLVRGDDLVITTNSVHWVKLLPRNATLQQQWQAILEGEANGDMVVIRKTATRDASTRTAVLDQVEGVLGDINADEVGFEYSGTAVKLRRERVDSIIYHHPRRRRLSEPICEVSDVSGSRWLSNSLQSVEGQLRLTTTSGVRHSLPMNQLAAIDYSIGNLTYLVDLKAESTYFQPRITSSRTPSLVSEWFRPRVEPGPIRIGSRTFDGCLLLHSRSVLTYRLQENHKRFLATVGIDNQFSSTGNVQLRISGDGRVFIDQAVSGGSEALDLAIDIQGVRRLEIVVDFGEDGDDRGDHLALYQARLTK